MPFIEPPVTRHGEWARTGRETAGGAGMTGGACGVVVPGVRVGTTEMGTARPAQVRCLTGRAADALGGAGANGRPGRGGCRCAARVGAAGVAGAGGGGGAGAGGG